MRPPAPRQVVLARDKLRAECALSAVPVPEIEMTVQKQTTKLVGRVGRSDFFLCLFPCSRREARLGQSDRRLRSFLHAGTHFFPNMDSSHWVAMLLQYCLTLPPSIQCKYWVG